MQSHRYEFALRDVCATLAPTVAGLVGLAAALHGAHALDWLPAPSTLRDQDRAVLGHQSAASRRAPAAQVLLIGDSSCLTSVDAAQLGRLLPGQPRVRNLALYSGVSLRTYGEVAAAFLDAHPGEVRAVVLLLTAGKLQDTAGTEYFDQLWREIHHGVPAPAPDTGILRARAWAGLRLVEERLLPRLLAVPLRGASGNQYGFITGIPDYLEAHDGSGVHIGNFVRPPDPVDLDRPLARVIAEESREVRRLIPRNVRLVAGIMPVPEGYSAPGFGAVRDRLLRDWNRFLEAEVLLAGLPATWPDILYANDAHMNELGRPHFTRRMARLLAAALAP